MFNFIHELPLKTSPYDMRVLDIRFEMGRFLYNAVLAKGFKRINLLKQSRIYTKAKNLKKCKERKDLFKKAREEYKFSDYQFQKSAIEIKNSCFIKDHLDTHVCQKVATRVYRALNEYLLGKRGKPRFKRKGWLSSLEGKSNISGIRFRKDMILWKGLELKIILNKKDKVQDHALNSKICQNCKKNYKRKSKIFCPAYP